jgi:type IV pilus assembly protein PilY1
MMNTKLTLAALAACFAILPARAQTVLQDNFTGASSNYLWAPFNGACLTAGDGTGTIPACVGLPYYGGQALVGGNSGTLPDDPAVGGALRFTNGFPGGYNQNGGIVSNFTFPTNQGLQVTFTTVTYRGDSGGAGADGADGISFFLMDGQYQPDLGAFGGSLAYTCSNVNNDPNLHPDSTPRAYDGLIGGYLGLGIDEFGNFLNPSDNTVSGPGYQPGRIGLRGAGSITWRWLNAKYPAQYPASLTQPQRAVAVQKTCSTGQIWDFAANPLGNVTAQPNPALLDYPAIPNAYQVLPNNIQIANEAGLTRGQAVPITYKLKITPAGLLSFSYSYNSGAYQPVITGQDITASNGALPASFRFGFAGSTGGSTNIHEIMCFQAAPANQASTSAGLNQQQSSKVQTGSQVYFAYYNPSTWAGSLTSQNLLADVSGNVIISPTANWDASCVLTGVPNGQTCIATNVNGPVAAQASAARNILTFNGASGIPFEWANLSNAQKTTLDLGDGSATANRLNFLRGDRSNEVNALGVGLYRARTSVLGDIIDSSPTWVGPPDGPYAAAWSDLLFPAQSPAENSGQTYPAFVTSVMTRTNVVYTGANDGLLHGFRTGAYTAANVYNVAAPNDGKELLAYMPGYVVNTIHSTTPAIDFSNPQYGHAYYVDAQPGTGDLFYNNAWHTWLVGGLGPGGAALYALDVTNPANFTEGNASTLTIGEWTSASIACANVALCGTRLGNTYGVPVIRRFHNGQWGVVFGNGLGSATGDAGIYIMLVNPSNGARTFYYFSTGIAGGNGIINATPADLDGDHVVDYVYAGDVLGHVWRFDVTNSNPSLWAVQGTPLFTTPGGQPITTKVLAVSVPASLGPPRILVEFGTGQQIPLTNSTPATYASGGQSLYGIWDWNMASWNAKLSIQYASLTAPQTIVASGGGANLTAQTILGAFPGSSGNNGFRTVSANVICWQGSTDCGPAAGSNTQFGWYMSLPGASEQVIYNPVLDAGAFIVNTTIPASNAPTTCGSSTASGWTMAISPATGGAFKNSFFGDANHNFTTIKNQVVSGVALNGTGSVSIVSYQGKTFALTQTPQGPATPTQINPTGFTKGDRLTWIQRR